MARQLQHQVRGGRYQTQTPKGAPVTTGPITRAEWQAEIDADSVTCAHCKKKLSGAAWRFVNPSNDHPIRPWCSHCTRPNRATGRLEVDADAVICSRAW